MRLGQLTMDHSRFLLNVFSGSFYAFRTRLLNSSSPIKIVSILSRIFNNIFNLLTTRMCLMMMSLKKVNIKKCCIITVFLHRFFCASNVWELRRIENSKLKSQFEEQCWCGNNEEATCFHSFHLNTFYDLQWIHKCE